MSHDPHPLRPLSRALCRRRVLDLLRLLRTLGGAAVTLHFAHPDGAPKCDICRGSGNRGFHRCDPCNGTGLDPDAKPEIEVVTAVTAGVGGYHWRDTARRLRGPFDTEADAIFAARCALAGCGVTRIYEGEWAWNFDGVYQGHTGYSSRDDALRAAIESKP